MSVRSLGAVVWTALGQALTALGTLLGVRLITGLVSPDTYGEITLLVGISGLAVNLLCTPLTQAAIHEFPASHDRGETLLLRRTFSAALLQILYRAAAVIVAVGIVASLAMQLAWWPVVLLAGLLLCDSWRTAALALLNAAHQHRRYAIWVTADAWLRPLLAIVAAYFLGASVAVVLSAYLLSAVLLLPLARQTLPWPRVATEHVLRARLWNYAMPLIPLGLIGWVTGLADRYVIGGALSLADAGIYAAAAGLASRPILMLGTTIELVVRPRYQRAVSAGHVQQARRLLQWWLSAVLGGGVLFVCMLAVWHQQVADWLLGPAFQSGSVLMPWIAAGYVMLIASYVFERVCYAHARTIRVLAIQGVTAVAAIVCLFAGAYSFGLAGAAMAVPVYYSVQLIAAMSYARVTQRELLQAPGARAHA